MEGLLSDVLVAVVNGVEYRGSLAEVLDYTDVSYYIDDEGESDPTGYHLLYQDLQRTNGSAAQLDIQRWRLYKGFYERFKREVTLGLAEVQSCLPLKEELESIVNLPVDEQGIGDYGSDWELTGPVSARQVGDFMRLVSVECGAGFSAADSVAIAEGLRTYFDEDQGNVLEFIDASDLTRDPLETVNGILQGYGCGLEGLATGNPVYCERDTAILRMIPTMMSGNTLVTPGAIPGAAGLDAFALLPVDDPSKASGTGCDYTWTCQLGSDQLSALQQLYDLTDGSNWLWEDESWRWDLDGDGLIDNTSARRLDGISCDCATQSKVTSVSLFSHGLKTQIGINGLHDWDRVSHLTDLVSLTLSDNELTGFIDEFDLTSQRNLQYLSVSNNFLEGDIAQWDISQLDSLKRVSFEFNFISGDISGWDISNLSKLENLWAWSNRLEGNLGEWTAIQHKPNLISIFLQFNYLTGDLSHWDFSTLSGLKVLYVTNNQLFGDLSGWDHVTGLNELVNIRLSVNHLTGNLSLFNASNFPKMRSIGFSTNAFTFSDLLAVDGIPTFSYSPQQKVDLVRGYHPSVGRTFELEALVDREVSPSCEYTWYKDGMQVTNGVNDGVYTISSFSENDKGVYHYTIRHAGLPNLTLMSRPIYVGVGDFVTPCLAYGVADDFTIDLDLNEEVRVCMAKQQERLDTLVHYVRERLIDAKLTEIYQNYRSNCMDNVREQVSYRYAPKEYHYTLYYYDQAGDLVQTVPPEGVHPLSDASVQAFLRTGTGADPLHEQRTRLPL